MAANGIRYRESMMPAVRMRIDIPDTPRDDMRVLRGVRIETGGKVWYWVYTRRHGWQITAIDQ